jgi:heme exporter protein D
MMLGFVALGMSVVALLVSYALSRQTTALLRQAEELRERALRELDEAKKLRS